MPIRSLFRKLFAPAPVCPARRPALGVDPLEPREVPAALVYAAGTRTVNMAELVPDARGPIGDDAIRLQGSNTRTVLFNGADANATPDTRVQGWRGPLPIDRVARIVVNGFAFDDRVDLSRVDTQRFTGMNGKITVDGNGGRDAIDGSAFADLVRGGSHNDVIGGGAGDDTLGGGSGNDWLSGGPDDDTLVGGAGVDRLYGNSGYDVGFIDDDDFYTGIEDPEWV